MSTIDFQRAVALKLAKGIMPPKVELARFLEEAGFKFAAEVARKQPASRSQVTPHVFDQWSSGVSEEAVIPKDALGHLDFRTARERAEHPADDLTMIRGISREAMMRLNHNGWYSFKQIAEWTDEKVAQFEKTMRVSPGCEGRRGG